MFCKFFGTTQLEMEYWRKLKIQYFNITMIGGKV